MVSPYGLDWTIASKPASSKGNGQALASDLPGHSASARLPTVNVEALPAYQVKARNTAQQSENAIHHDDVAQRYGFRGGLVPGVTVYAYLTEPLVATLGSAWLQRGTASVRFVKPLFDGEEFQVDGSITPQGKDVAASLRG